MENKIIQEIIDYKIHTHFQRASANIRYTIKRRSSNFELKGKYWIYVPSITSEYICSVIFRLKD